MLALLEWWWHGAGDFVTWKSNIQFKFDVVREILVEPPSVGE